ncbi:MAG: DUF3276 family protein [Spirochaetaceae bacterium]|jgi:hypothetical protein|nr:DUF3276 family protein [Spirochaetaceae bacterium]
MGIRGELFSTRVLLKNRSYFFNVKENRMGDLYMNIVESKHKESATGFDRQQVVLFAEDLSEFLKAFDDALHVLEKSERERKRGKSPEKIERKPDKYDRKPDKYDRKPDKYDKKPEKYDRKPEKYERKPKREGEAKREPRARATAKFPPKKVVVKKRRTTE